MSSVGACIDHGERTRSRAVPHARAFANTRDLHRLVEARETVAKLVVNDPVYLPIFERLDAEVAAVEAKLNDADPVSMARIIATARRQ